MRSSFFLLAYFLAVLLLSACRGERVPGGEITIRNDILDKEYNSFVVDQIMTTSGGSAQRITLRPHEQKTLAQKGVVSMRFTRRYSDYSRVYIVECPAGADKRLTIKLIDVHLNRLSGGCELTRRGESRDGFVKWER